MLTKTKPEEQTRIDSAARLRRVLLVGGALILIGVLPFLSGLVGSLILFAITHRAHERLARVIPRRISAFVIAIGVVGMLLVAGTWLVSTIVSEGSDAIRRWRPDQALAWLSRTPLAGLDVTNEVASIATGLLGWLSSRAVTLVGGATSLILNVVLALLGLYYLLLDAAPLWARVKRLLPVTDDVADLLVARFATVTDALLLGTVLTAVLQGTIVGGAFAIVGLHPAVLWGFVTACVSVFPLFGSAIVWLPGVIVLLLNHRPGAALLLAALGAVLASNLDNLVRPLVYRRVSGIHPMVTLVGAFAGVRLFGLIGAFIGPLVLSYFVELLGVYEDTVLLAGTIIPQASDPLGSHQF
jgi:predicted PurR-regulated permease PerM